MTIIKKNDFIEIEFTGTSNGEVFDTTDKKKAKEMGLDSDVKPVVVSIGNEMLLKGFDEVLEGKEIEKEYSIHLTPERAFGKRNPSLIKILPLKIFLEKNMNPVPGMTVQLDYNIAKILSVSGGRVSVDFNNPLAGKEIDYDFIIKRIITDEKEKINALQDFFFKQRFEFEIKEEKNKEEENKGEQKTKIKKVIFEIKDEKFKPLFEFFKPKFKEMIGFDFEIGEVKKEVKKEKEGKKNEEVKKQKPTEKQ